MSAQRCQTIGCGNGATVTVEWGPANDRATDRTCDDCAQHYARRPALRATIVPDLDAAKIRPVSAPAMRNGRPLWRTYGKLHAVATLPASEWDMPKSLPATLPTLCGKTIRPGEVFTAGIWARTQSGERCRRCDAAVTALDAAK